MNVVFFHRKPRPNYNFSVENLFKQVRRALPDEVKWEVVEASFYSEGFFKRLYIGFQAMFNQGEVNHVTGDINFIAIFLAKRKTVLTILDLGLMNHSNRFARALLRWFWVVLPVKRSAVVTTISEATRRELMKFVKVDPLKVKVVYVPINSIFLPEPKEFNKRRPRILQIGTKPNKNVLRLAQALTGIPCTLDIIGEIPEELRQELIIGGVEYQSAKNITNDEVLARYRNCDILSFASIYEGFGMPIVEANAIGRVVVTSNILSMPEVGGDAAHLVDPFSVESIREGILKVIHDDMYREKLIANGFENRKRFTEQSIAKQYTEIYKSLAQ